jgi:hypothetical protein
MSRPRTREVLWLSICGAIAFGLLWLAFTYGQDRRDARLAQGKAKVMPVDTMVAVATQVCRKATLGMYETDPDFPGRIHAWLWLPKDFKPGEVLVLTTKDARKTKETK